jgi:hypothetical protein
MSPVVATWSRFMFWYSELLRRNILSKFYREDGNSMFLLNAGQLLATLRHIPEDTTLQSHTQLHLLLSAVHRLWYFLWLENCLSLQ